MTQTQSSTNPPPPPSSPQDDDPLSHLHKMSITAGLGSGEYIAVNGAAVFAVILGVASLLNLFDESVFLLIPFVGVVVAIMAFRQISKSNGTQTGNGLVILGLLLSLGFGGMALGKNVLEKVRTREDREAIAKLVGDMGEACKAGKYDAAYEMFSTRFHEHVNPAQFQEKMKFLSDSAVYGKLKKADTGLMEFQTDESTGAQFGVVRVSFDFEKTQRPVSDDLVFKKEGENWRVESFKSLFPPPANPGRQ